MREMPGLVRLGGWLGLAGAEVGDRLRAASGASCMEQPQEVEDEEHERVWQRIAAVDVAKAAGVVCTRVPGDGPAGRRWARSPSWVITCAARASRSSPWSQRRGLLADLARGPGGLRS